MIRFIGRIIIALLSLFILDETAESVDDYTVEIPEDIAEELDESNETNETEDGFDDFFEQFDDKYFGYEDEGQYVHGTADTLEGTTLVISVLASDKTTSWDRESDADNATISDMNQYLKTAARYLEGVAADYGKSSTFITDFEENPDLLFETRFDADMKNEDNTDYPAWEYIDENIDMDALKTKYNADNVIFFLYFNTDEYSEAVTCTRSWYEGMEYPYEIVFLYNYDYGLINCPAVYAHEMLHAFGAPDLYSEGKDYNINSDLISYIDRNLPNEIMYTCSDLDAGEYLYDRVTNEVTDLTAYYVGLTDYSEVVEMFGLTGNEHLNQ